MDEAKSKLVLKKGGGLIYPQPSLKGNLETKFFNEVVKALDKPVAKPSYASAPLITLRELMPRIRRLSTRFRVLAIELKLQG